MKLLHRALWRHLLRHPAQLSLALVGLTVGVAGIVAVDIAAASARRAFGLSVAAITGPATHQVEGGPRGLDGALYLTLRHRLPPGIALAPQVTGYVTVQGRVLRLLGIDPFAQRELGGGATAGEGVAGVSDPALAVRWFTQEGAVMTSAATARSLGLTTGMGFDISIDGVRRRAVLIGIGSAGGADDLLLTDIAQAQEWLGMVGRLSGIAVHIPAGAGGETALRSLRVLLPPDATLSATRAAAAETFAMTDAFTTNLRAMSLLALLVGALLIYSAVSFAIVQRRALLGVLRSLGATRTQVLSSLLLEAALLGAVGAACGVATGAVLSRTLVRLVSRTINDLYFSVAVNQVALPVVTVLLAAASGVGVALLATLLPALEVARDPPRLVLARSVLERRALGVARGLVWISLSCAAAAAIMAVASGHSLVGGFAALFLLLVAVAAATPAALRTLAQLAARGFARRSALPRFALQGVAGSLSRTGVAVAALGMALAAMVGTAIMVSSFRESLREWLVQTLRADIYVSAPGPTAGVQRRLDPQVLGALLAVPGIVAHTEGRRVSVTSRGGPVDVNAVALLPQSRAGFRLTAGLPREAWQAFDRGAILVSEPLAWRLGLQLHGRLGLRTAAGPRAFEVAGVYREYGNERGELLIDLAQYRRWWNDPDVSGLGLYLHAGTDAERVIGALHAAAQGRQALLIRSNAAIRTLSLAIFDRTFVVTRVLYWLAAAVAALGLVSALLAWQLERARELALLRTLGLTPRATAGLVLAQTVFMAGAALLAAIPAGLITALVLTEVINRRAFGWRIDMHLGVREFSDAACLALVAGVIAALYPAWRSARAPLAAGLREE
ncbi:MAG: ABC transporter permease [Proteobacteria bacterium]|nr:ABC transporter permease [Pseudomonadota bacterium]